MTSKADFKARGAPTLQRPSAEALFVGSFVDPLQPLDPPLPEIAFLGRSNVGKSSLLNALVGIKGLAKVSATPGKTQAMNIFRVTSRRSRVAGSSSEKEEVRPATFELRPYYLVDLPGYGYAKTSKTERARFATLIQGFLTARTTVTGIVWLLDARHEPSQEDRTMAELLGERGLPALAVLTKADKLGTTALRGQVRMIASALGLAPDQVEATSSKRGDGIAALRDSIAAALGGEEP
jgi:GTP-binding protein